MTPCEVCEGTCCKGLMLDLTQNMSPDEKRWMALHGYDKTKRAEFKIVCSALKEGRCSIYDTRPWVCKAFPVGGKECLYVVKLWNPEKYDAVVESISGRMPKTIIIPDGRIA
jgi:Fe-S-cluster containining protein